MKVRILILLILVGCALKPPVVGECRYSILSGNVSLDSIGFFKERFEQLINPNDTLLLLYVVTPQPIRQQMISFSLVDGTVECVITTIDQKKAITLNNSQSIEVAKILRGKIVEGRFFQNCNVRGYDDPSYTFNLSRGGKKEFLYYSNSGSPLKLNLQSRVDLRTNYQLMELATSLLYKY